MLCYIVLSRYIATAADIIPAENLALTQDKEVLPRVSEIHLLADSHISVRLS